MEIAEWETVRRRVAIAGRVTDGRGRSASGVPVQLSSVPQAFEGTLRSARHRTVEGKEAAGDRPDRVLTRHDGLYFFLDLPSGEYTVTVGEPESRLRPEQRVAVNRDKAGRFKIVAADFTLAEN